MLKRSEVWNLAVAGDKAYILIVCRLNNFPEIIFFCKPGAKACFAWSLTDYEMKI